MVSVGGGGSRILSLIGGASFIVVMATACSGQAPATEQVSRTEAPIIGGELDTTHKGIVSLLRQVQGGFAPSCTGTLLTQNLVLTARHCVAGLDSPDGASVQCGQTEFEGTTAASSLVVSIEARVGREGLTPYRVGEVWVPAGSSEVCGRDIALLLLEGQGIAAGVAQPIEPGFAAEVEPNAVFAAIGYGLQSPDDQRGETAGERMGVDDATVFCAGAACGTELIATGEWAADSPVCSGDSGGPALDQSGRVVGVTSRGDIECTVGIYTSVYAWKDFIVKGVFDAAEEGHYDPPTWAGEPPPGFDPGIGGSGGSGGSSDVGGSTSNAGGSGGVATGGSINIAGAPSSAGSGGAAMSPVADPLGLSCMGSCPGNYRCWAESGKPPGICVPTCSPSTSCPAGYACSDKVDACVPERAAPSKAAASNDSGGCSVGGVGGGGSWAWLGAAALLVAARRRRSS